MNSANNRSQWSEVSTSLQDQGSDEVEYRLKGNRDHNSNVSLPCSAKNYSKMFQTLSRKDDTDKL